MGWDRPKVAAANNFPLERLNLVSECDLLSLLIAFFSGYSELDEKVVINSAVDKKEKNHSPGQKLILML